MSPFAAVLEYVSGLVRMEGCITMSLRPKTEEEMIPACATFHVFDPCMARLVRMHGLLFMVIPNVCAL